MTPASPKSSIERNRNKGSGSKDKPDADVHVSTVKFVNVSVVDNKEDLLHLITNVIKNFSKKKSTLAQMRAGTSSITCQLRGKKVAQSLARKVADAFKKYRPEVEVHKPKKQEYYDITVRFIDPTK